MIIPDRNRQKGLSGFGTTEILIGGLAATTAIIVLSKTLFMEEEKFSKHILLSQVIESSTAKARNIDNTPGETEKENAKQLAINVLDKVIDHFGNIVISSYFRAPALNRAVGGSATSQHVTGQAADISAPKGASYSNADIFRFIQNNIPHDQLIWEFGTDHEPEWVHVSFSKVRNRKQGLKAVKTSQGTKYLSYYA